MQSKALVVGGIPVPYDPLNASNVVAFVDVVYGRGCVLGACVERYAVASEPVMEAGMVPTIRAFNCLP